MTAIGPQRASHDVDAENTPEVQAHLTWLKGAHSIKTGFDLLFCQFNTFRPDYPSGTFDYSRAYTQGPDPATASATAGYGLGDHAARRSDQRQFHRRAVAGAAPDQLQLVPAGRLEGTRTLTINLGVRFEYQTPFKERYNHLAYFDPNATEPVTGLKGVLTSDHRIAPLSQRSQPQLGAAHRSGLDLPAQHRISCRLWFVLRSGQRRYRFQPG